MLRMPCSAARATATGSVQPRAGATRKRNTSFTQNALGHPYRQG